MSKEKLGSEPAFYSRINGQGMSKRFYAACAAMQGLVNNNGLSWDSWDRETYCTPYEEIAKAAFKIADELLRQENE